MVTERLIFWGSLIFAIVCVAFSLGCTSPAKLSSGDQFLQMYQLHHPEQAKEEVLDAFVLHLNLQASQVTK